MKDLDMLRWFRFGIILLVCFFCQDMPTAAAKRSSQKKAKAMSAESYSNLKLDIFSKLDEFRSLQDEAASLNHSVILDDAIDIRVGFRKKLRKIIKGTPPVVYKKTHFPFIIYCNQAIKGMDFVISGIKQRDEALENKGWNFLALSKNDVTRVMMTDEASVWRPSTNLGFNGSLSSANESTTISLSGSASRSVTRNVDIGPSATVMFGEDMFSLNLQGFARWNFVNAFKNHPEIVPYVGGQIGLSSMKYGDSDRTSTYPLGIQGGMLWFFSRNIAINSNLMLNYTANSDSDSTTSFSASAGLRYTLPTRHKPKKTGVEESARETIRGQKTVKKDVFCTKCGTKNSATGKFCIKCGNSLKK